MQGIIEFSDWQKLDLRVARIIEVEEIENADKLWKITVDIGSEIGQRVICAGLKEYFSKEQLLGKNIVVFVNLQPRKIRGVESHGMLLAASNSDKTIVTLLKPTEDIEPGSKIS